MSVPESHCPARRGYALSGGCIPSELCRFPQGA